MYMTFVMYMVSSCCRSEANSVYMPALRSDAQVHWAAEGGRDPMYMGVSTMQHRCFSGGGTEGALCCDCDTLVSPEAHACVRDSALCGSVSACALFYGVMVAMIAVRGCRAVIGPISAVVPIVCVIGCLAPRTHLFPCQGSGFLGTG